MLLAVYKALTTELGTRVCLAEMGTADADLAYLKKENVYAHLGKVIDRVVAEKPKDACGLVEVLSTFVKEQSILAVPDSATLSEEIATRVKALKQLDQAPAEEGAPIQVSMSMPCAEKGSVQIFELIAQFLEQCHFTTAAHAIIAQCSEHVPPLEGVLQRFRSHVDNCALLLAELEADGHSISQTTASFVQAHRRHAFVHDLLDNLLRKLMATGQCLSDDKLLTCIDTTLKSEAFPKLDDIVLDPKQVDTGHILTISDVETSRFWESIQKEMQPQPEVSQPVPTADAITLTGMLCPIPFAQSQNPVEPAVSSHYIPKRRDTPQTSVWDVGDEYHDDEDPGYRIREIYEAELLAELSQKMASTNPSAPATEPTDADELTSAGIEQGNQSSATDDQHLDVSRCLRRPHKAWEPSCALESLQRFKSLVLW
eukprot:s1277_g10.t1